MTSSTFANGRHPRTGFTMVEMLTVIGIIVILIAILLPVVAKVRLQVRVAMTRQEMNKIAGAIDQYYLEFNHAYPGPFSNTQVSGGITITNVNGGSVVVTSTENMVLGVCGGLELQGSTTVYNSNDILSSLGPLNLNPNIAKQTRHVAFIDATPGQQMPDTGNTANGAAAWDAASGGTGITGANDSTIPEFMDKFNSYGGGLPRPILYLRARVGNAVNAGNATTAQISSGTDATTQYNYNDLVLRYGGRDDFYKFPGSSNQSNDLTKNGTNSAFAPWVVQGTTATGNAAASIWDTYLGNPNQFTSPRGVNAYILISAGADGIFGTQDDLFYP